MLSRKRTVKRSGTLLAMPLGKLLATLSGMPSFREVWYLG